MTRLVVGWTSTQKGMTRRQATTAYRFLHGMLATCDSQIRGIDVHHGDCIGGDAQFHLLATVLGCRTVVHPPLDPSRRAWCEADETWRPKEYLDRDRDIADAAAGAMQAGMMLAAPRQSRPVLNSGTWTTIWYGLQRHVPVTVILPEGTTAPGIIYEDALRALRAGAGNR